MRLRMARISDLVSTKRLSRRENFTDENVTSSLSIVSEDCGPLIVTADGVPLIDLSLTCCLC
jgi:hypothetical protein